MNPQIYEELVMVAMALYAGLVMAVSYDCIRIFRKIIEPSKARVIWEDAIYWILAAYYAFGIIIKYNYGKLRMYPIVCMLLAMVVYELIVGRKLVNICAGVLNKVVNTLLKPLKKAMKQIKLKLYKVKQKRNSKAKAKKKANNKVRIWRRREERKAKGDAPQPQQE